MANTKKNFLLKQMPFEISGHFKNVIKRAHQEPVKKYIYPQTEAQEVGWITRPLVNCF